MKTSPRATSIVVSYHPVADRPVASGGQWSARAGFSHDWGSLVPDETLRSARCEDPETAVREVLAQARGRGMDFGRHSGQPALLSLWEVGDPLARSDILAEGWKQRLAALAADIDFVPGFILPADLTNPTEAFIHENFPDIAAGGSLRVVRRILERDPELAPAWRKAFSPEAEALVQEALDRYLHGPTLCGSVFRDPPPKGQTMFAVTLEARDNAAPSMTAYVGTLAEASVVCRHYARHYGVEEHQWTGGQVRFTDRTIIGLPNDHAWVSHDGQVSAPFHQPLDQNTLNVPAGTLQDRELAADLYLDAGTSSPPVTVDAAGRAEFLDGAYGVQELYGDEGVEALHAAVHATNLHERRAGAATMPDGTVLPWELLNGLELERKWAAQGIVPRAANAPARLEPESEPETEIVTATM